MKSMSLVLSFTRPLRGLLLATALLTSTVASHALAEDPASSNQVTTQLRYRQAAEAFRQEKWDEARRLFLALWNEAHSYDVAVSLGQTEYQLGHYAAAAGYLQFALGNIPPTEKVSAADDYKKSLSGLQARTTRVKVGVDQPSAEVWVDGSPIGKSPLYMEVYVDPGHHVIEARLGDRTAAKPIEALAGAVIAVDLILGAAPAPATAHFASSNPKPGYGLANHESSTTKWVVVGSGAVLTAAAFAIGEGYAFGAKSKQSDVDRLKAQVQMVLGGNCSAGSPLARCTELSRAAADRNSDARVARATLVASGVLAIGTVATLFLWPASETSGRARICPTFDRSSAALSVQGAF